ncbi:palmitoyltransferase ZDHHC12-A isoform X2 [Pimephales promelas]|uniref:palmitoyltransferase ZDHHC12-A isoform X2 n=1 Tax=Pimephales promelas TaxID=90988 RepID=UPI001955633D|nr:palmitoyltransferase ZDHHC12-A isoform X2 [Pimephales promelas]KAG1968754.1 putative palmitoyltransferase ZDHHC12 [Pimephales promelas]
MFKNMFRSGCFVRTAHVILTWLTTLVLFLHNTDLRKCQERGDLLHPVMFSALVLLSVLLYFTVSLMDPGFVLSDDDTKGAPVVRDEELEKMIPQEHCSVKQRRCGFCFLLQPMRARHCRTCQRCVRRFDHHCPWIDNCVGERNHRWFLLYLCVQFAAVCWALQAAWSGVVFASSWQQWFSRNGFLLGAIAVTGVFSVVVLLLLCIHLYLASANTTTWEFMSRHRIVYLKHRDSEDNPFDRGVVCNLWDFFCVCRTVAWERIYSRHANGTV